MSWSPEQYLKFAAPRFRPALDLLNRITVTNPKTVFDLGCGTGNVTRALIERWPQAEVTGVDDSEAMLAQAAKDLPGARWVRQGLAQWRPAQPTDVIYSNAALHWLPAHEEVFPRLVGYLAPGGVLAAQMPANFNAPSHTLITETMRSERWCAKFTQFQMRKPIAEPAFYYGLLAPLAASLDIWVTEYIQVLEGKDPVKEYTKGTWLRQFLDALPEAERDDFEEDYAARVRLAYPARPDGKTLFPFKRLFIVLQKA
jgi:trans-aconitate 2-methyltransferase